LVIVVVDGLVISGRHTITGIIKLLITIEIVWLRNINVQSIVVVALIHIVLPGVVEVVIEPGPVSPDMDVMLRLTAKWLIVSARADEVHIVGILNDIVVVLVAVTFVIALVAHVVLVVLII